MSATGSSTSGATTEPDSSTSDGTTGCERSSECMGDTDAVVICVAEYASDTLGGSRSEGRCVDASECIARLDLARWCFDHAGCCEGLRCRSADGICEEPGLGQDTSSGGESSSSGEDTADSTSSDDSTSDSTGTGDSTGDSAGTGDSTSA